MIKMKESMIKGVYIIDPFVSVDLRGSFIKDYAQSVFENNDITFNVKEVFYSTSKKNVVRGIHFQTINPQAKLVRCITGRIMDVVVDLRHDSETFGQWIMIELSEKNNKSVYIPKGCGHGFLAMEDSIMSYKCDMEFSPNGDSGIIWNDLDLNIEWPIGDDVIISERDEELQTYQEYCNKLIKE